MRANVIGVRVADEDFFRAGLARAGVQPQAEPGQKHAAGLKLDRQRRHRPRGSSGGGAKSNSARARGGGRAILRTLRLEWPALLLDSDFENLMKPLPALKPDHVYLVANGDLRLSANQKCWPEQAKVENKLAQALRAEGWKVVR